MIEWLAVLSVLVVKVAWSWPLTTLSVPVPIDGAVVVEGHRAGRDWDRSSSAAGRRSPWP